MPQVRIVRITRSDNLENAPGSAVQVNVTRWTAIVRHDPTSRMITATWTAPAYVQADMINAVKAAYAAMVAARAADEDTDVIW